MARVAVVSVGIGLGFAACSVLTDFSPIDGGEEGGTDEGGVEDVGGEGGMWCHEGPDPCPAGTSYVPCGPVLLGSDTGEGDGDEEPEHVVDVSAYCMDTDEVTNGGFAECVAAGGCTAPHADGSATRASYYSHPSYAAYPVIAVDRDQAEAYCRWVGKRLPTEAEWEKAARGGCEIAAPSGCGSEDERTYPWGEDEPTCTLANFAGCAGDTDRGGARPAGASPYGVRDLAGNVQEWVADWYAATIYTACGAGGCVDPGGPPTGTERVFRGGAWESAVAYLRNANRFRQVPGYSDEHLGFRCVAPVRP
ncbi:MAG: formylglycine-generating enzyme family protein [Deltaproteobacteria bacterium]|nr:formylglycine-generating enzyme family protein [Deltaproteobacteria bacterium]